MGVISGIFMVNKFISVKFLQNRPVQNSEETQMVKQNANQLSRQAQSLLKQHANKKLSDAMNFMKGFLGGQIKNIDNSEFEKAAEEGLNRSMEFLEKSVANKKNMKLQQAIKVLENNAREVMRKNGVPTDKAAAKKAAIKQINVALKKAESSL